MKILHDEEVIYK